MLASAITFLIIQAACFVYGLVDMEMLIPYQLASFVAGIASNVLFLIWVIQGISTGN